MTNNKKIVNLFVKSDECKLIIDKIKSSKDNSNNSKNYYVKSLNFHIKYIELLSLCTKNNSFCVLNIRKLTNIDEYINFLKDDSVPYLVKLPYLELFSNIYYKDIDKNCQFYPLHFIEEFIQKSIYSELSIFYFHFMYLIEEVSNENFAKFNSKKNSNEYKNRVKEIEKELIKRISDSDDLKRFLNKNCIDNDKFSNNSHFYNSKFIYSNKSKEYWKYILNFENEGEHKNGVLVFLYEIFSNIKEKQILLKKAFLRDVMLIRDFLLQMMDMLNLLELKHREYVNIIDYQIEIERCLSVFPDPEYIKVIIILFIRTMVYQFRLKRI